MKIRFSVEEQVLRNFIAKLFWNLKRETLNLEFRTENNLSNEFESGIVRALQFTFHDVYTNYKNIQSVQKDRKWNRY